MIWFVGKVFRDVREKLETAGVPYGVFVDASQSVPTILQDVTTVGLDFSTPEKLIGSAKAAGQEVDAVLAAGYENYVLPAAILAQYHGVPGLTAEAAAATTDKSLMRAKFKAYNPEITPDFATVKHWDDVEQFMQTHDFPVMLKPTNLMKSLFITQNPNIETLKNNYVQTVDSLKNIADKIYTLEPPEIIIEECMTGSMHTVAGYADAGGEPHLFPQIVDCITGQDIGKHENYLYSRQLPSALDHMTAASVLAVAADGVRALGLTSTMLHIEIMLTGSGPKIIEIGARIGGYRTRMYEYAAGIDMNQMMIDVANGTGPDIVLSNSNPIAVLELFPDTEGRFAEISHLSELESLPSLRYVKIKPEPGDMVGRSSHGHKAAAIVILGNEDSEQFAQDLAYVREHVSVFTQS